MNATLLILAVLWGANETAELPQVQAKVAFGVPEAQAMSEIELWITKETAKRGFPRATPHTDWMPLNTDFQRLFTSKRGGMILDGRVFLRDGKVQVQLDGCNGGPLDYTAVLKPGERCVIHVVEDLFIAVQSHPSK